MKIIRLIALAIAVGLCLGSAVPTGTVQKCTKGCPCGNSCIDCSKRCRK